MKDWTLKDGWWEGPDGERLRAISGGDELDFLDMASNAVGSGPDINFPDMGGLGDFAGGSPIPSFGATGFGEMPGPSIPSGVMDPAVTAGSSGGFFSDLMGGLGKEITSSPLKTLSQGLGLGAAGLGIANSLGAMKNAGVQQKAAQQGTQAALSASGPAIDYGKSQIEAAQQGKLSGPLEASIAQWVQQAKADMQSRLAHLGISDSTAQQSYMQQIDLMAQAMKANLVQAEGQQGISALQSGGNLALGVGQTGAQQSQLLNNLIAQANAQLGLNAGRQG